MGVLQISSRIGAATAPWVAKGLKNVHAVAPFLVMGVSSLIAVASMLVLPETKGTKTAEVISTTPEKNANEIAVEFQKEPNDEKKAKVNLGYSNTEELTKL